MEVNGGCVRLSRSVRVSVLFLKVCNMAKRNQGEVIRALVSIYLLARKAGTVESGEPMKVAEEQLTKMYPEQV